MFLLLLGLEADDLQVAGVGDVCHDAGNLAPDPQQGPAQHVVVTQPHALEALLPLLDQLAAPVPSVQRGEINLNQHGRELPSPAWPFPAATAWSLSPAPMGAGRASGSRQVWAAHPLPDSVVALLQGELVTALPVFLGLLGQHLQKDEPVTDRGWDFPLSNTQLTLQMQGLAPGHPDATTTALPDPQRGYEES